MKEAQALIDETNRAIFTDEHYKEQAINAIAVLVEIAEGVPITIKNGVSYCEQARNYLESIK